jgi:threonine/homoserine/homoserine lactone efflux protein
MTIHWFFIVAGFIFVMMITPGPNNIMMANSGAMFGFRKTIPLMAGAVFGPLILLLLVATGGQTLLHYVWFRDSLRILCLLYLIYLAYKIASSKPPHLNNKALSQPLTFWRVAALQWLNPKVWSQYILVIGIYVNPHQAYAWQIVVLLLMFITISIPGAIAWTLFGKLIARYLTQPVHFRVFNIAMALLLLLTVVPVLLENFT